MSGRTLHWIIAGLISIIAMPPLHAQSFRTITASRLIQGEQTLNVNVVFAAGTLRIAPGDGRSLYAGELHYDEDKFLPVTTYNRKTNSLEFGLSPVEKSFDLGRLETPQRLSLSIAPQLTSSLKVSLGAAEAELDLGGLSLADAEINSGAAKTHLYFNKPNRVSCGRLTLKTGAAEFHASGLGNARCDEISFAGGVGDVLLDFTGEWSAGVVRDAKISLGLGQLTIRLPRGVGVAIEVDRFLASFDRAGLEKAGSKYWSPDYDSATAKLHISVPPQNSISV
jgi:hypothetical protein